MAAVMCVISDVNPNAILTPALVTNSFIRLKAGPQCCDMLAKFLGCCSKTVDAVQAAQEPATRLSKQDGLVIHSAECRYAESEATIL